ncbi:MAG TPA: DUF3748 domain-containing protein [Flavitalea sp.]|nr:DUF3748 domain-containing protein [Flavitalea sp.]
MNMIQKASPAEIQLTSGDRGFCINHTKCFSPDDKWIVFDSRNDDSQIIWTGTIGLVNVDTCEIKDIYHTTNQTEFGPGVGAASFFPVGGRVLFLHGIRNASAKNPYGFTRRSAVAIDINDPFIPIFMDARNISPPFTAGALRGGTHAHSVSGDGKWISFTYNDFILEQLSKENNMVRDLRTVGVMMPGSVTVNTGDAFENYSGEMFSAVVTEVTENPAWGSSEIEKAFDETWIGVNGYIKKDGNRQLRAIAFQGNVRDEKGNLKTEVFIADLPDDISRARPEKPLEGTEVTRPNVPDGVLQRRITFSQSGLQGPRHWLRSTGDGSMIAFLSVDEKKIIQIFGVSPEGGDVSQLTVNPFPVQSPFNMSPDDRYVAYVADNRIYITDLLKSETRNLTGRFSESEMPVGAPVWSNDGQLLAYNRYIENEGGRFLHIFLLKVCH